MTTSTSTISQIVQATDSFLSEKIKMEIPSKNEVDDKNVNENGNENEKKNVNENENENEKSKEKIKKTTTVKPKAKISKIIFFNNSEMTSNSQSSIMNINEKESVSQGSQINRPHRVTSQCRAGKGKTRQCQRGREALSVRKFSVPPHASEKASRICRARCGK